jgi:hypothetical protein
MASEQTRFAILCVNRTGSNMLVRQLATHEDVLSLPAIFSGQEWPKREFSATPDWFRSQIDPAWDDLRHRNRHPRKLLRELIAAGPVKPVVCFKHNLFQAGKVTDWLLSSGTIRKILLTRRNLLAAYSSERTAKITGQSVVRVGNVPLHALATFDAGEFASFCRKRREWYMPPRFSRAGEMLEIDYTEARTPAGISRIGDFLGVDPEGFGEAPTVKRNSDDILSRFGNPETARAWLAEHSQLEWATEQ